MCAHATANTEIVVKEQQLHLDILFRVISFCWLFRNKKVDVEKET